MRLIPQASNTHSHQNDAHYSRGGATVRNRLLTRALLIATLTAMLPTQKGR